MAGVHGRYAQNLSLGAPARLLRSMIRFCGREAPVSGNISGGQTVRPRPHPELTGGMMATSSPSWITGSSAPPSLLSSGTST